MRPPAPPPTRQPPHLLHEQYQNLETQKHAAQLGMWIFLSGEVLLFSAMFALYGGLRVRWPEAFAQGARDTVLWMGTTGTVCLLLASFLVALSVHAIRQDRPNATARLLWGAAALGVAFLALKFWEYSRHIHEGLVPGRMMSDPPSPPGSEAFWTLYYIMTGAHALHVIGGIIVLLVLGWNARRGKYDSVYHTPQELGGMYWHLVDVIWLFLWPFFYLMRS